MTMDSYWRRHKDYCTLGVGYVLFLFFYLFLWFTKWLLTRLHLRSGTMTTTTNGLHYHPRHQRLETHETRVMGMFFGFNPLLYWTTVSFLINSNDGHGSESDSDKGSSEGSNEDSNEGIERTSEDSDLDYYGYGMFQLHKILFRFISMQLDCILGQLFWGDYSELWVVHQSLCTSYTRNIIAASS